MSKHFALACGIAALSGAVLAAQQSPQPAASSNPMTVTATGCLKSWDGKGSPGASTSGSQFVLTNVEHGKPGGSKTPSSAGQASSDTGRAGGLVYVLSAGSSGVNLSQHLNHKVQITGTKAAGKQGADMAAPSTPPAQDRPDQDPAQKMGAAASMPTINVTALTMVSSTCP
jgi:hypothetical protein